MALVDLRGRERRAQVRARGGDLLVANVLRDGVRVERHAWNRLASGVTSTWRATGSDTAKRSASGESRSSS